MVRGDGVSRSGRAEVRGLPTAITLTLPAPVAALLAQPAPTATVEDRMRLVLDLARANIADGGGPFAAGVFALEDGALVAGGVNLVVPFSAPIAHAEIVAIALAGQRRGTFDLAAAGPVELVTSCEPCAMCLGAVPWSGAGRVVAGARDEDARAIGFDEGDKPADWAEMLRGRNVEVLVDVLRDEAAEVLRSYIRAGGPIYNGAASG